MWIVGFSKVCRESLLRFTTPMFRSAHLITANSDLVGRLNDRLPSCMHSCALATFEGKIVTKGTRRMTLAENLASLVEESSNQIETRPKSRMQLKRSIELRVKKKVKEQYKNGKFHDLLTQVIAHPEILKDAYNCIRLNSNVDISLDDENVCFESTAEELSCRSFDLSGNVFSISTKGAGKENLVLPKLKLKVVQEAIRMALEVVYKPHFSKISHGCRSGRGHHTALKYISKEISNPDWWFTLGISKKLDASVLAKLISVMKEKVEDPFLYDIIRSMFHAQVLNMEFGGFPKGHGLPQEGVLSPILMNIYLDALDQELYRLSIKYEALSSCSYSDGKKLHSRLRSWYRRQLKGDNTRTMGDENCRPRLYSCRYMDELFFAVSGTQDVALDFKSEILNYVRSSLSLDVHDEKELLPCEGPQAIRFLGVLIRRNVRESPAMRAVHKLKEKIKLFASQKQEAWDIGTVRVGKKWLAHGLRKVKESEIKHLTDGSSLLSKIACFRKAGMETDHWYKHLLKVWIQDINVKPVASEEFILSKYAAEPALPQELRNSFYKFQKHAEEYVESETDATFALLPNSSSCSEKITEIIVPIDTIRKRLLRYGLTTSRGHSSVVPLLVLQDDNQIIDWFAGVVKRWLRWYSYCQNVAEIGLIIKDKIRKSCIRTLAAKYRISESDTEKRFDLELSGIPSTLEEEQDMEKEKSDVVAMDIDEALMYGISYSGSCLLSLARVVSQSRPCNCFVMGCSSSAPTVYTLHVMERQKFPGWKTGFPTCIHPSLNKRRIGLCKKHLQDFYFGHISLQSIDFSSWK